MSGVRGPGAAHAVRGFGNAVRGGPCGCAGAAGFLQGVRAFGAGEAGSVLMFFAIAAMVLLPLVGAAVEFSRWNAGQAMMQAALDSSVLSAVETGQMTSEYVDTRFREGFDGTVTANAGEAVPASSCEQKGSTFTCSASARLPTALIGAVTGIRTLPVKVVAAAGFATRALPPDRQQFAVTAVKGGLWKRR